MRYMIGSQMDWLALPFIVFAFIAYVWVAERLVNRSAKPSLTEHETKVAKAA